MKRYLLVLLAAGALLAGSLAGCGQGEQDGGADTAQTTEDSNANTAQTAENDNVLIIGQSSEITSLDPLVEGGTLMKERCSIIEGLVTCDDNFELQPALAESWEMTDDTTWRVVLRDDVKFHDGTELNAEAVKWCVERLMGTENSVIGVADLKEVNVEDEYTLNFVTNHKNTELMACFFNPDFGIYAPSCVNEDGEFETIIGTGPFQFVSFDPSTSELVAEPFADYWGEKPSVDQLIMRTYTDANTRALALETGEINFAADVPFSEIENLSANENLVVDICSGARAYQAMYNMNSEITQDRNVRKALAYATDQETIVNSALEGVGTVANGPLPEAMAWCDTSLEGYAYDTDQALTLLEEAGYSDSDGDGILDRDGQPLTIRIITYNSRPGLPLIAQSMQSDFTRIGIQTEIQVLDWSAYSEVRGTGEYEIALESNTTAYIPSVSFYFEQYFAGNSSSNFCGYNNPEFDSLIEACKATEDTEEKYAYSRQLQQMINDDLPVFTVAFYSTVFVYDQSVHNFEFNPASHDYIIPSNISIE